MLGAKAQAFAVRMSLTGAVFHAFSNPRPNGSQRAACPGMSMILEITKYLREIAQTCISLARVCPHRATALGLEEVAADMMAKAKELEDLQIG